MTALVITGMHRSGTSLLASLLQRGGVQIGTQFLPASPDNPRGYFEDEDFRLLHEAMLHTRSKNIFADRTFAPVATAAEQAHAQRLIANRVHLLLWGWKDPRTCLFLDFWHSLLPQARYIFVYRSPLDVLLSLMRRSQPYMSGLTEGLEGWYTHNLAILRFAQAHPECCVVCHIEGLLGAIDMFTCHTARLGVQLTLTQQDVHVLYEPTELRQIEIAAEDIAELAMVHAGVVQLYHALQQRAEIAGPAEPAWAEAYVPQPLHSAAARARLLALCARIAPDLTEAFFATGDRDVATLQHHVQAAYAHTERTEQQIRLLDRAFQEAQTYALSLEKAFQKAQTYAQSLEAALERAETYAQSLEVERQQRDSGTGSV